MDAKIEARVAIEQDPHEEQTGKYAVAYDTHKKEGDRHCVGSVSREESVPTAAVIVDDVDVGAQLRILAGAEAREIGLENVIGQPIGTQNNQRENGNELPELGAVQIAKTNEQQHNPDGNPRPRRRGEQHGVVNIFVIATIEEKRDLIIER